MKTGDRVIYVEPGKGLPVGSIHTVLGTWICSCGILCIDIGETIESGYVGTHCNKCDDLINDYIQWWLTKNFRLLQYNSAHNELTNIIEEKIDTPIPVKHGNPAKAI